MLPKGLFRTPDGQNHAYTFAIVASLFLLWGFCNGMIDVMDKHFQEQLHLSLAQSAWVQFAHYLGYFLMALPAGWLASKIGYKGGIIGGLLMVAIGGFWFIPATHIAAFWTFLLGVCFIAAGLTFLETVANPYTTVLGPKEFSATRINLAQSCNGLGWVFGPIAGREFFYSTDALGRSTGAQTLWIPYAVVGVVVVVLVVIFARAKLPDLSSEDVYHLEHTAAMNSASPEAPHRVGGLAFVMLWLNIAALGIAVGMIGAAIASIGSLDEALGLRVLLIIATVVIAAGTAALMLGSSRFTEHTVWAHPHFSAATIAQFFYVAAQSAIFAYFINYMTAQAPIHLTNQTAALLASVAFGCFLAGRVIGSVLLKTCPPATVLGLYGLINVAVCLLVVAKLGWVSLIAVFASYFFMSIMFPTIFALGIQGLGTRAKKASGFIVMAIMGGAIMPKLMGYIADRSDVSCGFVVPMACFAVVAAYGFAWPRLSRPAGATDTADARELRPAHGTSLS